MIDEAQAAIVTAISARTKLAASITAGKLRVVAATKGNIATDIAAALGKLRTLIVVEPSQMDVGYVASVPGLKTNYAITIFENVLLNRTGEASTYLTAGQLIEETLLALAPSDTLKVIPTRVDLEDSMTKLLTFSITCTGRLTITETP